MTPAELVAVTLRYGDIGTIRRMGALLEREGVAKPVAKEAGEGAAEDFQPDPLDTYKPKRGTVDRRWGVVINEQG